MVYSNHVTFQTDKTLADYLPTQTRLLVMADGSRTAITAYEHIWQYYDFLLQDSCTFNHESIVKHVATDMRGTERNANTSFWSVVNYIYYQYIEMMEEFE